MPNQAKSKKRKLLPKFGIRFLLLILLVVSLPLAWLAGVLNEHRNENKFVRDANLTSQASGFESFCTKWYDYELARQKDPSETNGSGWLGTVFGEEKFARIEKLRFEGNAHLGHIDLSKLKHVKNVRIENSDIKDLNDIRCFDGLEQLSIMGCECLESLSGIENFRNLKWLYVSSAFPLESLEAISGLEQLEGLTIQLTDPDSSPVQRHTLPFKNLPKLKSLVMDYWPSRDFSALKDSVLLESILIKNCGRLETFDGIESAQLLERVRISNSPQLSDSIALGRLRSLATLEIEFSSLTTVAGICTAKQLSSLTLKNCNSLRSLQGIQNASGLRSLEILSCHQLNDVRSLGELTDLEHLTLYRCKSLENWQPILKLSQLESLSLTGNLQLQSLDFINPNSPLKSLWLSGSGIRNLRGLETFESLNLHISNCVKLETLVGLPINKVSSRFELSNCSSLISLQGIENFQSLEKLSIEDCSSLRSIAELSKLKSLTDLEVIKCQSIKDWSPLSDSTNLTSLKVNNSSTLVSADFLDGLTQIRRLDLSQTGIRNCQGMENLNQMSILTLRNCEQLVLLTGLPPASEKLNWIDLANCIALESLDGLEPVLELRDLQLEGCDALIDFSSIKKLPDVRVSPISTREKLQDKGILIPVED